MLHAVDRYGHPHGDAGTGVRVLPAQSRPAQLARERRLERLQVAIETRPDLLGFIPGLPPHAGGLGLGSLPGVVPLLGNDTPLFAGPWYGEFAFAIQWAALLRTVARLSKRPITVCARPGDRALYADFAVKFIGHDIECLGQCHHATRETRPSADDVLKWVPNGIERFAACDCSGAPRLDHIVYGRIVPEYRGALVVHARNRRHCPERNWAIEKWNAVVARLAADGHGPFIALGSKEEALPIEGAEDMRGADLQTQMNVLRSARLAFGQSSGPMHLASHCGCPHMIWYSGIKGEWQLTRDRYLNLWNPHNTPVWAHYVRHWQPGVDEVVGYVKAALAAAAALPPFPPAPRAGTYGWSFRMPDDHPPLTDEIVGVAVLVYKNLDDAKGAVAAVRKHTKREHLLVIFDNTPDDTIAVWAREQADVVYIHEPRNVGCSVSRNRMAEEFARRGIAHFVVMDQDVRPCKDGWLTAMLEPFKRWPGTGVVGWHLGTRQMSPRSPDYVPDATGRLPEIPGMCGMYATEAVEACGGWCPDIFYVREDTLICLMMAKAGYATRVVWPDMNGVRHDNPHRGLASNPLRAAIEAESECVLRREATEYRLSVPGSLVPGLAAGDSA